MSLSDFSREMTKDELDVVIPTRTVDLNGSRLGLYVFPGRTQLVLEKGLRKLALGNQKTEGLWREYFYRQLLNKENLFVNYSNEGLFAGRLTITLRVPEQRTRGWYSSGTFPKGRFVSTTFPLVVNTSDKFVEITFLTPDGLNDWYGQNLFVPVAAFPSLPNQSSLLDPEVYRGQLEHNSMIISLTDTIGHDMLNHAATFAEMMKSETGELYREIMANIRSITSNPNSTPTQLKVARKIAQEINSKFEYTSEVSTIDLILGDRRAFDRFLRDFNYFLKIWDKEIKAVRIPSSASYRR